VPAEVDAIASSRTPPTDEPALFGSKAASSGSREDMTRWLGALVAAISPMPPLPDELLDAARQHLGYGCSRFGDWCYANVDRSDMSITWAARRRGSTGPSSSLEKVKNSARKPLVGKRSR
jgi:hypothetical protein